MQIKTAQGKQISVKIGSFGESDANLSLHICKIGKIWLEELGVDGATPEQFNIFQNFS